MNYEVIKILIILIFIQEKLIVFEIKLFIWRKCIDYWMWREWM